MDIALVEVQIVWQLRHDRSRGGAQRGFSSASLRDGSLGRFNPGRNIFWQNRFDLAQEVCLHIGTFLQTLRGDAAGSTR
jgi:hypothetical protein